MLDYEHRFGGKRLEVALRQSVVRDIFCCFPSTCNECCDYCCASHLCPFAPIDARLNATVQREEHVAEAPLPMLPLDIARR